MRRVLVDTGPLVALLHAGDAAHGWAAETMRGLKEPLLTCESVLAETCHLVRHLQDGRARVLGLLDRDVVRVVFDLGAEQRAVAGLLRRYADVPMSLADGCLVRMAELMSDTEVLTLDRDFLVYRAERRRKLRVIAPWC